MEKTITRFTCDVQGCNAAIEQEPDEYLGPGEGWVTVGPPQLERLHPEYHICPEHAAPYRLYAAQLKQHETAWRAALDSADLGRSLWRSQLRAQWEKENPHPVHPGGLKEQA